MTRSLLSVPFIIVSLSVAVLATGCGGNRNDNPRARSTVTSAKDSRQELLEAKGEIGKVIADLDLINRQGDLKKAYSDFSDDLSTIKSREKSVRTERESMEKDSKAYIEKWQQEAASFQNDDLRRSSIDRQSAVKKRFTDVTAAYRTLEEEYRPFINNLTELHQALANDLTPAAVSSVKPVSSKVISDGTKVQGQIDDVVSELDGLIGSLSTDSPADKK